jgi:DNA-binding MarR family transcriptional regulator
VTSGPTSASADLVLTDRWFEISDGFTRVQRLVDADVERHGLPPAWFAVLLLLWRAPDHRMAMTPLAHELDITSGGLTKLVDKLERAGFTERQTGGADRRLVFTALTDAGRSAVSAALEHHAVLLRGLVLDTLGSGRIDELADAMRRLGSASRRFAADGVARA